jgi:hypothetical protein
MDTAGLDRNGNIMTEIERLRRERDDAKADSVATGKIADRLRTEVDRLSAENADLLDRLSHGFDVDQWKRLDMAEVEIELLRKQNEVLNLDLDLRKSQVETLRYLLDVVDDRIERVENLCNVSDWLNAERVYWFYEWAAGRAAQRLSNGACLSPEDVSMVRAAMKGEHNE